MAQSVFNASKIVSMDYVNPNSNYQEFTCGTNITGGGKTLMRRPLFTFDLTNPASGRALAASDTIILAELMGNVNVIVGTSGWAAHISRNIRPTYVMAQTTWNEYSTGNAWTTTGGDIATPPADAAQTSPTATGDQVLQSNLDGYVRDALDSRSSIVTVQLRADEENPASTAYYNVYSSVNQTPPYIRLRVTYADPVAVAVRGPEVSAGHGPHTHPQFDHLADVRANDNQLSKLQEIISTNDVLRRVTRQ